LCYNIVGNCSNIAISGAFVTLDDPEDNDELKKGNKGNPDERKMEKEKLK
jgi:hypothetical protein